MLILTSLEEGRELSPLTDFTFPFHTPSLYSGNRILWKAVFAAEDIHENVNYDENVDVNIVTTSPQRIVQIVTSTVR